MAIINWSEALSVEITEIDQQHQRLIDLINKLHDSMKAGQGNAKVGEILSELTAYTRFHFNIEEKYFQQYGYPEHARHKAAHDELTRKVKALEEEHRAGKITITIEVMNFLRDWVSTHILKADKMYAPFLRDRGLH